MTEISFGNASSEDPYQEIDQDEPMDTDSEPGSDSKGEDSMGKDRIPDTDSIQMEISDNEDSDNGATETDRPTQNVQESLSDHLEFMANGHVIHNGPSKLGDTTHQGNMMEVVTKVHNTQQNLSYAIQDIDDAQNSIHGLPITLWQKVFLSVPPISLGRLVMCTRLFHAILAPQTPVELAFQRKFQKDACFISSDVIWQASRNRFAPGLPRPLNDKSEIDMWRLLRGTICEVCRQRKLLITSHSVPDPWQSGPGSDGIRVIWPCGIRICGPCLIQRCQQEVSLQLSSTFPSFLIQALPALLLTQFNDWVPESILLTRPPLPHFQIRKLYYQPQIDAILLQFKNVRDLGEAAAGEWIKGLSKQRSDVLEDASRWEQWELKGGLEKVNARQSPRPLPITSNTIGTLQKPPFIASPPTVISPPLVGFRENSMPQYHPPGHGLPMQPMAFAGPQIPGFGHFQPPVMAAGPQVTQTRPRRSLQEVNEARAARRREIERRCLELDPPINPKVLAHMQSFQAALQISFPFTDKDWEVLKPRLLAQREVAESQEAILAEQLRVIQNTAAQPSLDTLLTKDPNELAEDHWELLQKPVHDRLGQYADERIENIWEDGSKLTQENASHFAADVLLTARNKYYESFNQPTSVSAPRIPVSLESMKWLFDTKIKSLTEVYQKDLFTCNACDTSSKVYGFEGVIQHYAAKHTTALSLGNIIVNWRTEWPDVSPFTPYLNSEANGQNAHIPYQGLISAVSGGYGEAYQNPTNTIAGAAIDKTYYQGHYTQYQQQSLPYGLLAAGGSHSNYPYRAATENTVINQSGIYGSQNDYTASTQSDRGFTGGQIPYLSTSPANDPHLQQLAEMAQYSRDLWNATMGIKELQPSIRVSVLIKHMSTKFEKKFGIRPDVSMFLHGLNENAQMRPIRSLNGLTCKACSLQAFSSNNASERKLFTLPALAGHFKSIHVSQSEGSDLDWRLDMVETPENSIISNLITSNGMDDRKFHLIAETFPDAFPSPLPSLTSLKEIRAKEEAVRIRLENLRGLKTGPSSNDSPDRRPVVADNLHREEPEKDSRRRMLTRSPAESTHGPPEAPGEDEYDPTIPSFFGQIIAHSGLPRSSSSYDAGSVPLPPGIISLGVLDKNDQPQSPHTQGGYADRLLRHHRGLPRHAADSRTLYQHPYPMQADRGQIKHHDNAVLDARSADQFLQDLLPSQSSHYDHGIPAVGRFSSSEENSMHYGTAVRPFRDDLALANTEPQYLQQSVDYHENLSATGPRYNGRQFGEERYRQDDLSDGRRPSSLAHTGHVTYRYPSRDRSRSPVRSIPRDNIAYDPNLPSPIFEERFDTRWRGETPSRGNYYRANPEILYEDGSRNSFVSRDNLGRNVRYVAMPVEEYETRTARYIPAGAVLPTDVQYTARPNEAIETRPDGGFYVVGERDVMRYADGSAERHYRDY